MLSFLFVLPYHFRFLGFLAAHVQIEQRSSSGRASRKRSPLRAGRGAGVKLQARRARATEEDRESEGEEEEEEVFTGLDGEEEGDNDGAVVEEVSVSKSDMRLAARGMMEGRGEYCTNR